MECLKTYKINLKRQFIRQNTKKQKEEWYKFRRKIKNMIRVATKIANYVIQPDIRKQKITSKHVKHLGDLKTTISNQIIRKYKNNKKCKKISNVNLIIPANHSRKYKSVQYNDKTNDLYIVPLKLHLKWTCPIKFIKINQVEINKDYAYVCITVNKEKDKEYKNMIGVDLNIKHNLASVGNPSNKTVKYLGKDYIYKRVKYKKIRRRFQKQGRLWKVKEMNNKEQRVMNDLNHKLSNEIVKIAKNNNANITFENLKGIRKTAKVNKNFKYFLNSWQFYTLQSFVEYKSMIEGIRIVFVNPKYTSQICSNCDKINKCESKKYVCSECKLHIHRDENASYNIANRGIQASNSLEDSTGQLTCPDSNPDRSKVKPQKIKVKSKDKSKNGSGRKSRTPRL